eukprot:403344559
MIMRFLICGLSPLILLFFACFSYNEQYVFAGSQTGTIVVWDVEAQKIAATFKEHLSQVNCLAAQRKLDGPYLVSGSLDTNVKTWDLRSKKSMMTCKSHSKPITSVDISVDGRIVASGSQDTYVKIWENSSSRCIHQLRHNHLAAVTQVAISPRDLSLVAGHSDRFLRYWDLDIGNMICQTAPCDTTPVQKFWFHDDGRIVLAGMSDSIKVWDIDQATMIDIIMKPQSVIFDLKPSSDMLFVAEFNNAQSTVCISQISIQDINMRPIEISDEIVSSITSNDMNSKLPSLGQNQQNLDFYNQKGSNNIKTGSNGTGTDFYQQNKNNQEYIFESPQISKIDAESSQLKKQQTQKFQDSLEDFNSILSSSNTKNTSNIQLNRLPSRQENHQPPTNNMRNTPLPLNQSQTLLKQQSQNKNENESNVQDVMRSTARTNLSSLYEIPIDKPLNLDIGKFLLPNEVKYNGNDLEIIQEAMKQSQIMDKIVDRRQKNMRTVLKWWGQGNINSTINALSQMNDLSIVNDFMSETLAQNQKLDLLTMENTPAILAHCLRLINSKYESHTFTGIQAYNNIFKIFQDVKFNITDFYILQRLMQAKSVTVSDKVDIEREKRMEKIDVMIDQFERILTAQGWDRALKSQNQEIREIAGKLDNDLDFFIEKCKKKQVSSNFNPKFD